nr:unnamed protein product [Digitaria exilis]
MHFFFSSVQLCVSAQSRVAAILDGTHDLQPVQRVAVGRGEQIMELRRRVPEVAVVVSSRESIGVHEPKHGLESRGRDVVECDGRHGGFLHGAQELCFQDRRPGGEHGPVSRERLAAGEE